MATFFTSDIHFGHSNLKAFCPETRCGFQTVDKLDQHIIRLWNVKVQTTDTIYVLGDLALSDPKYLDQCLKSLKGRKILVKGNHDKQHLSAYLKHFANVYDTYHEIRIDGQLIVLCHFPIWEWNQIHRGSWHLHGHVHGKPTGVPGKILDVGMDNNTLEVFSLEQVKEFMSTRPVRGATSENIMSRIVHMYDLGHPYTLKEHEVADRVYPGWNNLIRVMLSQLFDAGWEGHLRQIKEKFGTLCVYLARHTDELSPDLSEIIYQAEAESSKTCRECGAPGKLRGGSWLKVLCDTHAGK